MLQAKYRKGIWVFLAIQLLAAHLWLGYKLVMGDIWQGAFYRLAPLLVPGWLLGSCIAGAFQLWIYQQFRRKALRGMEPVEESWIRNASGRASEEAGVQKSIPLYQSTVVNTPMILGFHSQVLLIPKSEYEWSELYMIFLHEWTHVKKRDVWYKLTFTMLTCLLWFQPLMYFLRSVAFRDVEVACDQQIMRGKAETERTAYAQMLVQTLRRKREREFFHSACFTNSKAVMKARISIVLDEGERLWFLGALVLLLLAVETAAMLLFFGFRTAGEIREQMAPEPVVNIYEGYEIPESFTDQAVEKMTELVPVDEGAYSRYVTQGEYFPEIPFAEQSRAAEGPWQIRLEDPNHYLDTMSGLLFRYLMYYENQELGSSYDLENAGNFTSIETVSFRLLAGDEKEYVCAVIFRELLGMSGEKSEAAPLTGGVRVSDGTYDYLYYNWTVHARQNSDYIYELVGVAETPQVLEAMKAKYPEADFSDLPELDPKEVSLCSARVKEERAEVTWDDGQSWTSVPVSLEKLFARGDQMEGVLTGLQDRSYVVSEDMTAFAYGGDGRTPVTVTCSSDKGVTWNTSVLTYDYVSVRRLFLSFPDVEHGFLVLTTDRTVWQEGTVLFRTEDGGVTWREMGYAGPEPEQGHSLTTGAVFVTSEVGFLTIRDSERPDLWRTQDGGETWTKVENLELREYYGTAYPPEYDADKESLRLYVGMEDYSELGGPKCRYHSGDLGKTWTYEGLVLRR